MHISTVKSFVEIVQYILKIPGAKFFLSERISQDPLENFFGVQRQRGRTGDNPNASQFCKNTQAIRLINSVCANVKGNCRGRKQSIDMEDNNPLPKRRRVRKKASNGDNKCNAENKNPLLHENTFSPTPVQKVVSSPVSTPTAVWQVVSPAVSTPVQTVISSLVSEPVQQTISPPVSAPVQQVISSSVSAPAQQVISPPPAEPVALQRASPDCSIVSIPVSIPAPPVLSPILTLDQSVVSRTDQSIVSSPASTQSISIQVRSLLSESGEAEEIISKHHGIVLQRQDLWTLNNHRWLNDQVSLM